MDHVADFPAKLDLLLKALSLSRVALAQRIGVDKSLVGRWLGGTVHPSEHNLTRLTAAVSETFPAFRLSDWFLPIGAMARRHGLEVPEPVAETEIRMPGQLGLFLDAVRPELQSRGAVYEGFWRTSRPSLLMRDQIFHDFGMIRQGSGGLVEVLMEGSGLAFSGWLFPAAGNIFVFLFDSTGRTPMSLVFKGVSLPKATVLDGILLLAALDAGRTPSALPIVIERIGDLTGDTEADLKKYREIVAQMPEPAEPLDREALFAHLFRDFGPIAAAAGSDLFLTVNASTTLTRGVTALGLKG